MRFAIPKKRKIKVAADEIADKASRGEDISAYFTNEFTVVRPVPRGDQDITQPEPSEEQRSRSGAEMRKKRGLSQSRPIR